MNWIWMLRCHSFQNVILTSFTSMVWWGFECCVVTAFWFHLISICQTCGKDPHAMGCWTSIGGPAHMSTGGQCPWPSWHHFKTNQWQMNFDGFKEKSSKEVTKNEPKKQPQPPTILRVTSSRLEMSGPVVRTPVKHRRSGSSEPDLHYYSYFTMNKFNFQS